MGSVRIKNIIQHLIIALMLFVLFPVAVFAKEKISDFDLIQADVRLPQLNFYLNTKDDQSFDKENVDVELKAHDINCQIQSVEAFKDADAAVKYYVLFDISTSVSEEQFKSMKQSLINLSDTVRKGDMISVITFGKQVKTILDGSESKDEFKNKINNLKREKKTHLYEGLTKAASNILEDKKIFIQDEDETRQLAVILTDWQEIKDAGGQESKEEALKEIQKTGVPLYGYCLDSASVSLQDDMGAFLRNTGGVFTLYSKGNSEKDDVLVKFHEQRLKDYIIISQLSSTETSNEADLVEISVDGISKTKENLYLNLAKADDIAPTIEKVEEDGDKKDTLVVTFSEAVKNADNKNNYTVTWGEKDTYPVIEATYTEEDGQYKVTLVFNELLSKGKYTIAAANITDCSDAHNPLGEEWSGELNGQGTAKNIISFLGKIWPVILFLAIVVILLVIYLVIKKNKGLMIVNDKIVMGDHVGSKQHIKQDNSLTKYIAMDVHGINENKKSINLQVISSVIVGRSDICDVYFDDLNMSKQHFAIEIEDGQVFITDLESKNGTFVNEKQIDTRVQIHPGDVVRAGAVSMTMRW